VEGEAVLVLADIDGQTDSTEPTPWGGRR
jgi:hypothetical protein